MILDDIDQIFILGNLLCSQLVYLNRLTILLQIGKEILNTHDRRLITMLVIANFEGDKAHVKCDLSPTLLLQKDFVEQAFYDGR